MTRKKLSRSEVARLGGLARARKTTLEQRQEWGARAGATVMDRYGAEWMTRLALHRHGRLPLTTNTGGAVMERRSTRADGPAPTTNTPTTQEARPGGEPGRANTTG